VGLKNTLHVDSGTGYRVDRLNQLWNLVSGKSNNQKGLFRRFNQFEQRLLGTPEREITYVGSGPD
jgi:hypothetical protein